MIYLLIIKIGRFIYRIFGISSNQRRFKKFDWKILTSQESNNLLHELILDAKPTMISRFGSVETNAVLNFLEIKDWDSQSKINSFHNNLLGSSRHWNYSVMYDLSNNAGFFPAQEDYVSQFSQFYLEKTKSIDAIGIWRFVPGETYLISKYCNSAIPFDPIAFEPYFFNNPWSKALEGKKVLVIHPFSNSIQKQYLKREKLFRDGSVLPKFELKTIKAVQSIAGNKTQYSNWFEALASMQMQIDTTEFDVAIIGAGSYGLPLSAYVKKKGKVAIHIGGATQILFGIKGKRWDKHPIISRLYNEYWIRPDENELVLGSENVEDSCYW
jgi:hypothetical protein